MRNTTIVSLITLTLSLGGCEGETPQAPTKPEVKPLAPVVEYMPNHPNELTYPEYVFTPPMSGGYKKELSNGVVVYIVEDRELPLINIAATFRGGDYLDPEGMVGLVDATAYLMRDGGTQRSSAEEVDELLDFLASSVRSGSTDSTINVSLNCLADNFEESFDIFQEVIQQPRFQESRLALYQDDYLEEMKQRNDRPSTILSMEYGKLLYGDSFLGNEPTESSINSIAHEDLTKTHRQIISPNNLLLSVSGDFNGDEMVVFLEDRFGGWAGQTHSPPPPDIESKFTPGIYFVDQDVPQGSVRIAVRTIKQGDPDAIAASVMNNILGGGGFTSRITRRVRSDEGLAYSAGSSFSAGVWRDGVWRGYFDSKNPTVALATKIILEEVGKIKNQLVSEEDLQLAKSGVIESFPSMFQTKDRMLSVFVNDDISGRDADYWTSYRDRINAITVEDVQRVAKRLLNPKEMLVLIVGDWGVISEGDLEGRATMQDISDIVGGDITELPLRNPMTLEVMNE